MTTARLLITVFFAAPAIAYGALGLKFNGEMIVPVGQLKEFSYDPSAGSVDIETFFGDIRCMPADQAASGNLAVSIDRFERSENLEEEIEATYKILSDGGVEYDPSESIISLTTSGDGEAVCEHSFPVVELNPVTGEFDRDTFWISDFSGPISISSDSTGTLETGDQRTVPFTFSNDSGLIVAKGFSLELVSSPQQDSLSVTCDPQDVQAEIASNTMTIPVLWPQESCTLNVTYDLTNVDPGETIQTELTNLTATNRIGGPLDLGTAGLTVVNTSTAP